MQMSATKSAPETLPLDASDSCQLVVFSEDTLTRESAMEICGGLLVRFQNELSFSFSFWKFQDLKDINLAHWVAEDLERADIVVFSLRDHALAPEVSGWLEMCIPPRTKKEGALALIVANPSGTNPSQVAFLRQMQHLADRLGMDFLPLKPRLAGAGNGASVYPSPELLNQALNDLGYEHWGLNE